MAGSDAVSTDCTTTPFPRRYRMLAAGYRPVISQAPMMRFVSCPIVLSLLSVPVLAQTVTTSFAALAPLTLQATDGSTTGTTTIPAGPLGGWVSSFAVAPDAVAHVGWYREQTSVRAFGYIEFGAQIISGSTASNARSGPHEFLLEFAATGPAPARLTFHRDTTLSIGAAWPLVQLDVDNDGTIDVPNLSMLTDWQLDVPTFGTQPLRIRVLADAALVGAGRSTTKVSFSLEPSNDAAVTSVVAGCAVPLFPDFTVVPSFADRGIDVYAASGVFRVIVIGLSPQPLILPSPLVGPCLLLPSLDIVVPPDFGSTFLQVHLPLPPAMRPVTFYAQAVELFDFGTSDVYRVVAN